MILLNVCRGDSTENMNGHIPFIFLNALKRDRTFDLTINSRML